MLRSIHLHGSLGEQFGPLFKLDVATAGEAIRALHVNLEGFGDALKDGAFEIVRGETIDSFHLDLEDVMGFRLGSKDLHIVPVVAGSKRGGLVKTILGVALIGAAVFFSGGALAAPIGGASGLLGGFTYGNLALVGLAVTLAGVSKLLTPSNSATSGNSNLFSVSTTSEEGVAVPLVYGRYMAQPILISAGLSIERVSTYYNPYYIGESYNYYQQGYNGGTVNGQ